MISCRISSNAVCQSEVEIFGKKQDIIALSQELLNMIETGSDHIHLFHKDWGGNDLSDEFNVGDGDRVVHIKIYVVP